MEITEPVPPPYGDDLRIDSDDDEDLERLPEIERELILSERHETLLKYKEEKAIYDRLTGREPEVPEKKSFTGGRKRAQKAYSPSPSASSESSDSISGSSSESGSGYSSESMSGDEEKAYRGLAKTLTEKELSESLEVGLSRESALKLQVTRDQLLSAFQDVPAELREEALMDAFVRVPSGEEAKYVISSVKGVKERALKSSESGAFDLLLEWPTGGSTCVPVSSVSNAEITDVEVKEWIGSFGIEAGQNIARKASRKQAQIKQVKDFVWDDRTINRILSKKKSSSVNLTLEVAKLRTALQAELGAFNNASASEEQRERASGNINRLNKEIAALEAEFRAAQQAFAEANAHQFGIVAINHRNRTEQRMQDVEEARKRCKKSADASSQLNPFKRRECKPVVMWDVGKRSPKKVPLEEPASPEQVSILENDNLEISGKKRDISDLISLEKIVKDVTAAVSYGGSRLNTVRRAMRAEYSEKIASVWKEQLSGIEPGEVMDFSEWKRRVAAEDMVLD